MLLEKFAKAIHILQTNDYLGCTCYFFILVNDCKPTLTKLSCSSGWRCRVSTHVVVYILDNELVISDESNFDWLWDAIFKENDLLRNEIKINFIISFLDLESPSRDCQQKNFRSEKYSSSNSPLWQLCRSIDEMTVCQKPTGQFTFFGFYN